MDSVEELRRYELSSCVGIISSPVCNALYDPTGKFAVCGALSSIHFWSLRTGDLVKTLSLESSTPMGLPQVTCLEWHPTDSDILAAGYEDGSIRLWDAKNVTVKLQFNGHRTAVTALAFSPLTHRLASGGRDSDIVIWDIVAEDGVCRLQGHSGGITSLCFIHSGHYLLSSARDSLVRVWDVEQGRHSVEVCVEHRGEVLSMAVSADERILLTCGQDPVIRVFSIDHSVLPNILNESKVRAVSLVGEVQRGAKDRALQIAFAPDNRTVTVLSGNRSLELFELRNREEAKAKLRRLRKAAKQAKEKNADETERKVELSAADLFKSLRIHKLPAKAHSFGYDPSMKSLIRLLVALNDNRLQQLDVSFEGETEVEVSASIERSGHRSEIRALAVSSDQRHILSAGPDGARVWGVESGQMLRSIQDCPLDLLCGEFHPDCRHVLMGSRSGILVVADAMSGDVKSAIQAHEGALWSLHLGSDGRTLVTGSSDKSVKVWEMKFKGEEKVKIKALKTLNVIDECLAVRFTPDLRLIAVALLDMTVRVFYADSLRVFLTLYGHKLPVTSIDVSPDGKTIITASPDKTVKVWGVEFGELKKSILAHSDGVTAVRFVNGPIPAFVSASKDKSIKLFSAAGNYEPLQRSFNRHSGEIWALAVSASGGLIATAGADKSILIHKRGEELLIPQEEVEREAEVRLEQSLLEDSSHGDSKEPGVTTLVSLKAGEKVLQAIEAADLERQEQDEAVVASRIPVLTPIFATIAKGKTPCEYLFGQLEQIPLADLEQALLALPTRLIPSLLHYIDAALDTNHIMTAAQLMNTLMRLFFHEITSDTQLQPLLQSVTERMQQQLRFLEDMFMFNAAFIKRACSLAESGVIASISSIDHVQN